MTKEILDLENVYKDYFKGTGGQAFKGNQKAKG